MCYSWPVMSNEEPIVKVFFDDAGNTGEKANLVQRNMFLGAILVPIDRAERFWEDARRAWTHAEVVCGRPEGIELKGSELYGGGGVFRGVALTERQRVIELVFEAVSAHHLTFFWEGVPKHLWREEMSSRAKDPRDVPLWKSTLFAYCGLLYELLDALYEGGRFLVVGDQNSWIDERNILIPPPQAPWPRLLHEGVVFESSRRTPGLQVADLLVHTLYRANKASCPSPELPPAELSPMDRVADVYWQRLLAQRVPFALHGAVEELRTKRGGPRRSP